MFSGASWAGPLEGRYLVASAPQPFDAFYDREANLTWLADANYVKSHCEASATTIDRAWFERIAATAKPEWLLPLGRPIDTMDMICGTGAVVLPFAKALVATLNIGGVSGWTLPPVRPKSGSTFDKAELTPKGNGAPNAKTGPLRHLMQVHLKLAPKITGMSGNTATDAEIAPKTAVPGLSNGYFANVTDGAYWLEPQGKIPLPQVENKMSICYQLSFAGAQVVCPTVAGHRAAVWPVHEGDVGRKK